MARRSVPAHRGYGEVWPLVGVDNGLDDIFESGRMNLEKTRTAVASATPSAEQIGRKCLD